MAEILVVDDEADMRLALANVLARGGHRIEQAPDGNSALERLEKGGVDLVLMDIRMPGLDGVQTLRRLRERHKSLPVIMVTGYGSVDSAMEVMQLGASHYLSKPFSNKELIDTVSNVLKGTAGGSILRKRLAEKVGAGVAAAPAEASPREELAPVPAGEIERLPAARPPLEAAAGFPWGWTALAGAVVLAAALTLGRGEVSYPIAYQHPAALVWAGDRLWSADWFTQTVYEQKLEGGKLVTLRSIALAGSHVSGLAVADGHLYVADSWKRTIEKRRLDGPLTLVETASSPGPSPSGLFFDGRYLWSSDLASRRLYQHDLDRDLTVLASFRSPGKTPSGLFKDSRFLWSADSDTRVIYQHRLDKELNVIAKYTMPALDQGKESLASFTWKDGDLWLARDGLSRILRRKLGQFRRISVTP